MLLPAANVVLGRGEPTHGSSLKQSGLRVPMLGNRGMERPGGTDKRVTARAGR